MGPGLSKGWGPTFLDPLQVQCLKCILLYSISYSQVEHAVVIKHAYNVVYWRPRGCAVCTQLLLGLRLLLCSRSRPHQRSRLRLLRFRARLRSRSGLYLLSLSLRMCFRTCQTSRLSTQRLSPRLSLVHRIEDARLRSCRSGSDKQSCLRRDLRLSLRRFESRGCDKLSCNRRDGARLRRNESRGSMKLSSATDSGCPEVRHSLLNCSRRADLLNAMLTALSWHRAAASTS